MPNESTRAKIDISHLLPNVAGLFLAASGSIILAWVGWLTWYDMTSWGKNIALVFFESRTDEAISLGIGMKIIHYFLISLALLLSGLLTFLRRRSKWLHHLGYLANLPKNAPIPQDFVGKLARARAKLVAGITLITILGVSLSLSPLRGNTFAVVGVFASFSAIIIALLAAVEIEIITVEEKNAGMDKTSLKGTYAYEIVNDAAKRLDFSQTNTHLTKTNEFKMDVYSSENQITLSSHYTPRRAYPVKRQPKKETNQTTNSSNQGKHLTGHTGERPKI